MRHLWKIVAVLSFGLAFTPAVAADGIRASGIATRTAPADIVSIGFQIAEPAPEPDQEKDANELRALVKAFEARGIKVLEASESRLPFFNRPNVNAINNVNVNTIGPASTRAMHTKQLMLKLSGFKRTEDIAEVLDGNGIRQNISYTFDSSKFDAIQGDLQREAITRAIAQAKDLARDADVQTGKVIDLSVVPVNGANFPFAMQLNINQIPLRWNMDQNLIPPAKDGELSLIRYTAVATVVLAVKPE